MSVCAHVCVCVCVCPCASPHPNKPRSEAEPALYQGGFRLQNLHFRLSIKKAKTLRFLFLSFSLRLIFLSK